jgi:hypothetical protein
MPKALAQPETPAAIRTNFTAIFVSIELSHSIWLITSLSELCGKMGDAVRKAA